MPKMLSGLYTGSRAISPETLHNSSKLDASSLKTKKNSSRFWILSMIIEHPDGKNDIENQIGKTAGGGELEAILPPEPVEEVCLLRDSPFRILRGNLTLTASYTINYPNIQNEKA